MSIKWLAGHPEHVAQRTQRVDRRQTAGFVAAAGRCWEPARRRHLLRLHPTTSKPSAYPSTPPPEHSWPRGVLMAALRAHPSLGECMTRTRRAIGRLGHASLHPGMARLRILPLAAPRRGWQPLVMSYLRTSPGGPFRRWRPLARARGSAEVAVAWHGLSLVCQRSACVLIANGAGASGLAVSA